MSRESFRHEMNEAMTRNRLLIPREEKLLDILGSEIDSGASCVSLYRGSIKGETLMITSIATHALRLGLLSTKLVWSIQHGDLEEVSVARRIVRGYVNDLIVLRSASSRDREFFFGFYDSVQSYEIEIAEQNAVSAAEEISQIAQGSGGQVSTGAGGSPFSFDLDGPEKTGNEAKIAYGNADFVKAFHLYVRAIDQLHDFYVYEQFRNRQPSPKDTWLVEGLTASLGAARQTDSTVDLREGVRQATHRLRTISSACENSGANPVLYRRGLEQLSQYAPDIDVSDIYWT
jgi:hypothetical protein